MRDDAIFEARLADAFGRYADAAPAMDDDVVAREAIWGGRASRRIAWLPSLRVAYLLVVLGLLLAAIAIAMASGTLRNDPLRSIGREGGIVFTVQGNDHTWATTHLMKPDGTSDHAIGADRCPVYSRDGSTLSVLTYDTSAYLAVIGSDGVPTRKVLLEETLTTSVSYALSPDGSRVAWFKPDDGLWVAPIDGGPGRRILPAATAGVSFDSPVWSPDGTSLVFGTYVADPATGVRRRAAISIVGTGGHDLRQLTSRPGLLGDGVSWSPDGRLLAYLGRPDDAPATSTANDVFVIGADGTGDRNVTGSVGIESQPEWAPDGAAIAFLTSPEDKVHRLTTVRMNGTTPAALPVLGPESEWFVWSPDADSAAVARYRHDRSRGISQHVPRDRPGSHPNADDLAGRRRPDRLHAELATARTMRRSSSMSRITCSAMFLCAVVVLAACGGGSTSSSAAASVAVLPSPASSVAPTATPPTVSLAPRPSPSARTFVSKAYGYSVTVPAGWSVAASSKQWGGSSAPSFNAPELDKFELPDAATVAGLAAPTTKDSPPMFRIGSPPTSRTTAIRVRRSRTPAIRSRSVASRRRCCRGTAASSSTSGSRSTMARATRSGCAIRTCAPPPTRPTAHFWSNS